MRPIIMVQAMLCHPHRPGSRYVPNILDLPEDLKTYTIRREFGQGGKYYSVFDDANPVTTLDQRLFHMVRSRAVKGSYKFYTESKDEPTATLRAGIRSNVLLISSNSESFELGWHVIGHRVDALDSYRVFTLSDGSMYQWTTRGKYLEKVSNPGEKESEIRERIASVTINDGKGFTIKVDESKILLEMALCTAMISYIDQWNTQLGVGGIYYAYQAQKLRWSRV